MKQILRPMLGAWRRVLAAKAVAEAPAVLKAAVRTAREDVREFGEHLRDVKKPR